MRNPFLRLLLLPAVVALSPGCDPAPDAPAPPAEADPVAEAPVSEEMRLSADELTGLEEENVLFALPWVAGPVNKEPPAGAEPVAVRNATTLSDELFDRVVFSFAEGTLPGYHLEWAAAPPAACATGEPVELAGTSFLAVRLRSVSGPAPATPAPPPGSSLQGVALTCAAEGDLEWHMGFAETGQIRVVEMRAPGRLVVDVRRP